MKTRETFEEIRNRKKEYLTLRVRMILAVQAELLLCGILTVLIDLFIKAVFPSWKFPFLVEFVVVSMIASAVSTSYVSKFFFAPMKKLRMGMDRVADGDFTVRLKPDETGMGEVKELYAGFNLMVNELNSTEMLQSDFVSNVSHEFKTPINAIEGYATLLQDIDELPEASRREYIDKILFNTRRLSGLAGNILLLSKLETGAALPQKNSYRLDEQIRQAILLLESEWTKKDIEFDVEMDDVEYCGYENLMQHVWYNLIGNAVKFNPHGGCVSIRLTAKNERIVFSIEDSGPGISEKDINRIFDKFYQGDQSHKQEGNGLGLALVNKIVKLSGGCVSAENLSEGGCCFTVELKNK